MHSSHRIPLPYALAMRALTEAVSANPAAVSANTALGVLRTDVPRDDDAQRVALHAAP